MLASSSEIKPSELSKSEPLIIEPNAAAGSISHYDVATKNLYTVKERSKLREQRGVIRFPIGYSIYGMRWL